MNEMPQNYRHICHNLVRFFSRLSGWFFDGNGKVWFVFIVSSLILIWHGRLESNYQKTKTIVEAGVLQVSMETAGNSEKKTIKTESDYYAEYYKSHPNSDLNSAQNALIHAMPNIKVRIPFPLSYLHIPDNYWKLKELLSEQWEWHMLYRVVSFLVRFICSVSLFILIVPWLLRIIAHMVLEGELPGSNAELFKRLCKQVSLSNGVVNTGTSLMTKTMLIGGAALTLTGGTFAIVMTLKAPVVKLTADPIDGEIRHNVILPKEKDSLFSYYTSSIKPSGDKIIDKQTAAGKDTYFVIIDKEIREVKMDNIKQELDRIHGELKELHSKMTKIR